MKLEDLTLKNLGRAKSVTVTNNDTLIIGGLGEKQDVEERLVQIREKIANSDSTYETEKLRERLAKLTGGVAQIRVGGASEVAVNEKKDRVVDALNATKAAIEEGIVPGGGTALLYASLVLDKVKGENFDQKVSCGGVSSLTLSRLELT
eukprot:TRINITY_DN2006_c0_g1_i2.p2 TRINITY_DN2006_c0_g1~~TRINITY_DN2006_c0_g1_i2.p2  ORF type:complete len:149 (-),score=53.21 TRINITY_DN2006_c0_g1_i2:332-778(-)